MADDDRNLFNDEDDDLFGDFNDETTGDDLGGFDDFDDLDDDDLFGDSALDELDEEPEDLSDLDEEEATNGRSPLLIILGVVLIVLLLGGVALLAFALANRGPSELDVTRTAIAQANATTESLLQMTNTASAATEAFFATATAASPTPSPTATFTPSPTVDTDATSTALAESNQAVVQATQVALDATATAIQSTVDAVSAQATQGTPVDEVVVTPTQEVLGTQVISVSDVEMTATALVSFFEQPEPTLDQTDGGIVVVPTPIPGSVTPADSLPDTGLFDDLAASGAGPGVLFLMAFGLLGVIFVSRRLRGTNRD